MTVSEREERKASEMKKPISFALALFILFILVSGCTEIIHPAAGSYTNAAEGDIRSYEPGVSDQSVIIMDPTEEPEYIVSEQPIITADPAEASGSDVTEGPDTAGKRFSTTRLWLRIKADHHDHIFTEADFPEIDIDAISNDYYNCGFSEEASLACLNYTVVPTDKSRSGILDICRTLKLYETVDDAVPEFYPDGFDDSGMVPYKITIFIKQEYHDHVYTMEDFPEAKDCALIMPLDWLDPEKDIDQMWYIMVLPVHSYESVISMCETLNRREDVLSADVDYYGFYCLIPNDYLPNNITGQWGLAKVSMPQAWDIKTGSSSVRVGVIDSGIECNALLHSE